MGSCVCVVSRGGEEGTRVVWKEHDAVQIGSVQSIMFSANDMRAAWTHIIVCVAENGVLNRIHFCASIFFKKSEVKYAILKMISG
jgi:hypothetical protein